MQNTQDLSVFTYILTEPINNPKGTGHSRDLALICFWCDIGVPLHQIKEYESTKHIIHGAK